MADWLRPLLMMFYAPARGMAEVRDRVPLGQAALLALLLQLAYAFYAQWYEPQGAAPLRLGAWASVVSLLEAAGNLLVVALIFVPAAVLLANLFERRASFGLVLRQEYAPMASTAFYALAAASLLALPLVYAASAAGLNEAAVQKALLAATQTAQEAMRNQTSGGATEEQMNQMLSALTDFLLLVLIKPLTLFTLWAVAAVREVFRLTWWRALALVVVGTAVMFVASPLLLIFRALFASPFLVLLVFFVLRGYFGEMVRGQRARAAFRQNLEAATLNPADASAHYNLGLLHMQRKEYAEARARFLRAVEIDPEETDAHYQLGRIARAEGKLAEAIEHFGQVVARDEAHSQHEVWREVGATYLSAGQFKDAQDALQRFLDKRPSDPEGLYLMGRAHAGLGHAREAVEWMQRCVEAVRTAPAYKYRADQRWLNEAQQFLRTQA
jgi:tetratricopeptide (TPR) repeat protein